jgi:uncharacterized protein YbaR (Trm112 family)
MKSSTLVLLACPQCLKDLSWRTLASGAEELVCHSCQRIFPIVDGVPFFAMRATDAPLELQEMDAEVKWIISEVENRETIPIDSERIKKHQKAIKQMRDYNLAILKVFERDWASHADRFRRT